MGSDLKNLHSKSTKYWHESQIFSKIRRYETLMVNAWYVLRPKICTQFDATRNRRQNFPRRLSIKVAQNVALGLKTHPKPVESVGCWPDVLG
jgi:hypothetical protein